MMPKVTREAPPITGMGIRARSCASLGMKPRTAIMTPAKPTINRLFTPVSFKRPMLALYVTVGDTLKRAARALVRPSHRIPWDSSLGVTILSAAASAALEVSPMNSTVLTRYMMMQIKIGASLKRMPKARGWGSANHASAARGEKSTIPRISARMVPATMAIRTEAPFKKPFPKMLNTITRSMVIPPTR